MANQRKDEKTVERALEERATDEKRQWSGSTPTEDVMERALEKADERPERGRDLETSGGDDGG